ncbi:unnamed protein product, partial [marine sediment metagenome]
MTTKQPLEGEGDKGGEVDNYLTTDNSLANF